jgi:hypothetical protein
LDIKLVATQRRVAVSKTEYLARGKAENSLCFGQNRIDGDKTPSATAVNEPHPPIDLGVKGIVAAQADIDARLQLRAALPYDNGASGDNLAAENLHSQSLRIGIATVPRAA